MRVSTAWGVVLLLAFMLEASLLSTLQWYDARVAVFFAGLRGCAVAGRVAAITIASGWVAAAFLVVALVLAVRRRASFKDVAWTVIVLTGGLLLAQALKLVLERSRPWTPAWHSVGDSFPSGHIMNAALFVGAAWSVLPRRASGRDFARLGLAAAGMLFILIVLLTRLYLGRHWFSDVTGSLLLSLAVAGLMTIQRTVPRVVVLSGAVATLTALFLIAATGGRIALPSPAAPAADPEFRAALRPPALRAEAGLDGTWVEAKPGGEPGFLQVSSPEIRLSASLPRHERALLHVVARPLRGLQAIRCAKLMLLVDGALVGELPFARKWRSYTFPLPPLAAGRHEVRLRVWPRDAVAADVPMLALRDLQVERLG